MDKPMTPEERAEKIVKVFMGYEAKQAAFYDHVLTEIRQAVEDGFNAGREQGAFECRHAKEIGVREAYEHAAKIAEEYQPNHSQFNRCNFDMAKRIRNLSEGK